MSLKKTIASIVMISALAAGSMWAGDKYNINARVKEGFYSLGGTKVESNFYNKSLDTNVVVMKDKNGIEYFLKTPQGNLPMLNANSELQVGSDSYVINSVSRKSLEDYVVRKLNDFGPDFDKQVLHNMNSKMLEDYVVNNLQEFSPDFKKKIISKYASQLKDELSKEIADYSNKINDFLSKWLNKP